VPVTAKLSRKFYEAFGDDIANELVNWFNDVDAAYRADLRELNELNFARFDAKLEQRVAALDAKIELRIAQLGADLRTEFHRELSAAKTDLIKWTFGFWIPTALGVIGLYFKG
jgi:hypothetical protein